MSTSVLDAVGAVVPRVNARWAEIEVSGLRSEGLPYVRAGDLAIAYAELLPTLTNEEVSRVNIQLEQELALVGPDDLELLLYGFIEGLQNLVLSSRTTVTSEKIVEGLGPLGRIAWYAVNKVWDGNSNDAVATVISAREQPT